MNDQAYTTKVSSDLMKRGFDIIASASALIFFLPLFIIIGLCIKLLSPGPILFWSDRVGRDNKIFAMPKFRSMFTNTPSIATDLMKNPEYWITPLGAFLRKTSLDELPQLWSILKGDMSAVGPRPALYNQYELIELRTKVGIDALRPGLTGWAQVNGRDDLSVEKKVALDHHYLVNKNFKFDILIIWLTLIKVIKSDGVSH